MSEIKIEKAKEVYATMCSMLDNRDWAYDKLEDDLVVKSSVKTDDFPVDFIMTVNPDKQLVSFFSWFPFTVEEAKRIDLALAICAANDGLANGSFDFDLSKGSICFRLTSSYRGSVLGEELFEYMLCVSVATVDEYNDKFFMIAKGAMTAQQFIESDKNS